MIARSRNHLVELLGGRMGRVSTDGTGEARRAGNLVPLKTYLIEGRGPIPPDPDEAPDPLAALVEITEDPVLRGAYATRLHRAEDPDLASVELVHDGEVREFVYADCADPRHWLLHTFAASRLADRFVATLAAARSGVGRAILPGEFLEAAAALGSTLALTLRHERQDLEPDAGGSGGDFVKARIWGTRAGSLLSLVRVPGAFAEGVALSTVQVRHRPEAGDGGAFCVDDLSWNGRIVARGTSLRAHLELTAALQECYALQIATIESLDAGPIGETDGIVLGRSLALHLTRPIRRLERLCRMVFSSAHPFRLWGIPVVRGRECVSVAAVDLNLGQPVWFEFTPTFIRLFLPRETSGGTVVRFYTNLQHHLDPRVRLVDHDEREVFQL